MANALNDIIKNLEQQRKAIERALTALRDVGGIDTGSSPAATKKATRKGGMTPGGRKRLSEALRQRWAAKRAAAEGTPLVAKKTRGRRAKRAA